MERIAKWHTVLVAVLRVVQVLLVALAGATADQLATGGQVGQVGAEVLGAPKSFGSSLNLHHPAPLHVPTSRLG